MRAEAKPVYRIIDLFAGCGGISRGFENTGRFVTQAGVELNHHPASAFKANLRNKDGKPPHVHVGDIDEITKNVRDIDKLLKSAGIVDISEVDVIVGGPPCQGFSRNGVRQYEDRDGGVRFYDDPRNHLYKSFLNLVEHIRPKAVLVENVREFLNFGDGKFSQDLISRFDELGYDIAYRKLCAADFGVPQVRHRVFFVGIRRDVSDATGIGPKFPVPTNADGDEGALLFRPRYHTVKEAFAGLPEPVLAPKNAILPYDKSAGSHILERYYRSKRGIVSNHVARKLSEKQLERIRAVGTGRMRDVNDEIKTRAFYGSAYRRLDWDKPSLTVTTWVYHVGSGQFAHPEEDRGVTMREAARLQGFDDDFVFPPLINPVSQMIGNAVPPLLAQTFAAELVTILDAYADTDRQRKAAFSA